jgi:hypothetical protein
MEKNVVDYELKMGIRILSHDEGREFNRRLQT